MLAWQKKGKGKGKREKEKARSIKWGKTTSTKRSEGERGFHRPKSQPIRNHKKIRRISTLFSKKRYLERLPSFFLWFTP
jgi:hypothetical protein